MNYIVINGFRTFFTKFVTGFAKKGLLHAYNLSTLMICNSACVGPTTLQFGSRTFLSLYVLIGLTVLA